MSGHSRPGVGDHEVWNVTPVSFPMVLVLRAVADIIEAKGPCLNLPPLSEASNRSIIQALSSQLQNHALPNNLLHQPNIRDVIGPSRMRAYHEDVVSRVKEEDDARERLNEMRADRLRAQLMPQTDEDDPLGRWNRTYPIGITGQSLLRAEVLKPIKNANSVAGRGWTRRPAEFIEPTATDHYRGIGALSSPVPTPPGIPSSATPAVGAKTSRSDLEHATMLRLAESTWWNNIIFQSRVPGRNALEGVEIATWHTLQAFPKLTYHDLGAIKVCAQAVSLGICMDRDQLAKRYDSDKYVVDAAMCDIVNESLRQVPPVVREPCLRHLFPPYAQGKPMQTTYSLWQKSGKQELPPIRLFSSNACKPMNPPTERETTQEPHKKTEQKPEQETCNWRGVHKVAPGNQKILSTPPGLDINRGDDSWSQAYYQKKDGALAQEPRQEPPQAQTGSKAALAPQATVEEARREDAPVGVTEDSLWKKEAGLCQQEARQVREAQQVKRHQKMTPWQPQIPGVEPGKLDRPRTKEESQVAVDQLMHRLRSGPQKPIAVHPATCPMAAHPHATAVDSSADPLTDKKSPKPGQKTPDIDKGRTDAPTTTDNQHSNFGKGQNEPQPSPSSAHGAQEEEEEEAELKASLQKMLNRYESRLQEARQKHSHASSEMAREKADEMPRAKIEAAPCARMESEVKARVEQERAAKSRAETEATQEGTRRRIHPLMARQTELRAKEEAENEVKAKAEAEREIEVNAEDVYAKAQREAKVMAERQRRIKARAEAVAKANAEKEAKAKAAREALIKTQKEAKAVAERQAAAYAEKQGKTKAKAEADAKAKAEKEAKAKADREAMIKAEKEAFNRAQKQARAILEGEAKLKEQKEAQFRARADTIKAEKDAMMEANKSASTDGVSKPRVTLDKESQAVNQGQTDVKAKQDQNHAATKPQTAPSKTTLPRRAPLTDEQKDREIEALLTEMDEFAETQAEARKAAMEEAEKEAKRQREQAKKQDEEKKQKEKMKNGEAEKRQVEKKVVDEPQREKTPKAQAPIPNKPGDDRGHGKGLQIIIEDLSEKSIVVAKAAPSTQTSATLPSEQVEREETDIEDWEVLEKPEEQPRAAKTSFREPDGLGRQARSGNFFSKYAYQK